MKRAIFVLGTLDYQAVRRGRSLLDSTIDLIEDAAKFAGLDPSIVIVMEDPLQAGKSRTKLKQSAIRAERPRVLSEIGDAGADVVICLGPVATACVFGKGNLAEGELLRKAHHPLGDDQPPVFVTFSMDNVRYKAGLAKWLRLDVLAAARGYSETEWGHYDVLLPGTPEWDTAPLELFPLGGVGGQVIGLESRRLPGAIGFDLETYPGLDPWHPQSRIRMAVISNKVGRAWVVQATPDSKLPQWVVGLAANPYIIKSGSNIKFDYRWMRRFGYNIANMHDTSMAEHIIDCSNPRKDLKSLTFLYAPKLGDYSREHRNLVRVRGGWEFVEDNEQYQYCGADGEASIAAYHGQMKQIKGTSLEKPYALMSQLYPVIADMERHGSVIDLSVNRQLDELYQERLSALRQEIVEILGPINLNSTKQLAESLKRVVPSIRLVLRDWVRAIGDEEDEEACTQRAVLERESFRHPVIAKVLEFRKYRTRHSTFIAGIHDKHIVQHTGNWYIHPTYRADVVETHRLSSQGPNDQNMVRKESCAVCKDDLEACSDCVRMTIKRQFVSRFPGGKIMEVDQSQIEIRFAAWLSQDAKMLAAIAAGGDIHTEMAAIMLNKPVDQISPGERQACKARTFLILYGGGARKLARDLKIPVDQAQRLINEYFDTFAGLRTFIAETHAEVKRDLYVKTLWGFIRWFARPEIWNSPDGWAILRQGFNTKIQNGAVGVTYCAMIWMAEALEAGRHKSVLFKQVHDSLVLDVAPGEEETMKVLARQAMTEGAKLVAQRFKVDIDSLPLHADIVIGTNWGEGKKVA